MNSLSTHTILSLKKNLKYDLYLSLKSNTMYKLFNYLKSFKFIKEYQELKDFSLKEEPLTISTGFLSQGNTYFNYRKF